MTGDIIQILFVFLLSWCALWDLALQQVPLPLLIGLVLCGGIARAAAYLEATSALMRNWQLFSLLPGLLLLASCLPACLKKTMGAADLLALAALVLRYSFSELFALLAVSFVLAGLTGALKLIFYPGSSEETLPLIPFMALGVLI
ncbi:MAG: hypothetical protein J6P72_09785 [Firmicutes bacterium]|nr:hypothetical protein [Bacillota bacterium]